MIYSRLYVRTEILPLPVPPMRDWSGNEGIKEKLLDGVPGFGLSVCDVSFRVGCRTAGANSSETLKVQKHGRVHQNVQRESLGPAKTELSEITFLAPNVQLAYDEVRMRSQTINPSWPNWHGFDVSFCNSIKEGLGIELNWRSPWLLKFKDEYRFLCNLHLKEVWVFDGANL